MSTMRSRPPPAKKISSCVRPGVREMRASALRPVSALIRLDLPTLERPAKAISSPAIGGSASIEGEAQMKCQSPANSFRPCSISSASMSVVVMRRFSHRHCEERSDEAIHALPGGMDCFASLAMTNYDERRQWLRLRLRLRLCRLLRHEGRLEIVEQLHLHAVAAHDVAL